MSGIDHVVFDIGRVLLNWNPEYIYLDRIPDEAERRKFLKTCAPWNAEQDLGWRSWQAAEDELIAQHPDKEEWIRAYWKHWIESVPNAHEETVAVMRSLIRAGYDVTLLTNFNDETWLETVPKFPFLNEPRGVTVSARVHMSKPEAKIFHHHTETFNLAAGRILFFDDSPANVEGARTAGWQAERYEGAVGGEALKMFLSGYGIEDL